MDQQAKEQAFMSALVTEHFALQSTAGATINESGSRASLYMLSLSSSLVALGFAAQRAQVFTLFAAAVIPAIFLLGIFTFVRVSDTVIQNMNALRSIVRIHRYYAGLVPEAGAYFGPSSASDDTGAALESLAIRRSWLAILFTTGSMVAAINSIVGGAGVAMVLTIGLGFGYMLAVAVAALVAVILMVVAVLYQYKRLTTAAAATP